MESTAHQDEQPESLDATGFIIAPMAAAAALDSAAFSKVNASEGVPATWEERARKAWEYYVEEPLVKNCINSWRTFAVGDEIKIAGDEDKLKLEATEAAYRLNLTQFIKDMILQLRLKVMPSASSVTPNRAGTSKNWSASIRFRSRLSIPKAS